MNRREFLYYSVAAGSAAFCACDVAADCIAPQTIAAKPLLSSTSHICPSMDTPSGRLSAMDPLHVYSVSQGALFSSNDGGSSWKVSLAPKDCYLLTTAAVSRVLGWAGGTNMTLFRTRDGGTTWSEQRLDDSSYCITSLSFASEQVGYAAGEAGLYRMVDGTSWSKSDCPAVGGLIDLRCCGEMNAWGVDARGILLHTADRGKSWKVIPTPAKAFFVSPVDAKNVFLACEDGQRYSADQGKTWTKTGSQAVGYKEDGPILGLQTFISPKVGWVVGYVYGSGRVYRTRDGGKTWSASSPGTNGITGLAATSENDLWIAGGNYAATTSVVHSQDGGVSWRPQSVLPNLSRWPWQS